MNEAKENDFLGAGWRKATFSDLGGGCVEVALDRNWVAVRDSKDPSGPVLRFSAAEWNAFLSGVDAGEFDLPDSRSTY
ncbi:DUF397 domain-containing protein [Nonomuraea candida]|uniref:DUF397 domain-containing protein n=1 Tax=Nonomuraea candida TaxID=359159 RepID=UPI0005BB9E7B|nr:DUF397 domain-containing protein [Nonomuraea candida]